MNHSIALTRFVHAMLVFVLVVAMCVPMHAFADEPSEDAASSMVQSGDSSLGDTPTGSSAPEGPDGDVQGDSGASLPQEPAAVSGEPAPAVADVVTMKQGEGEAKSYDSIAAALADVADYHYKNNKEAYVITLNQYMSESVTIPANKKVTIDLNGKQLNGRDGVTLTVQSKYVTLQDSVGGGSIFGHYYDAVKIEKNSKLTIAGGRVAAMGSTYAVANDGTLAVTGGAVEAYYTAISNNGTVTVSGGSVSAEDVAIANLGKVTVSGGKVSNARTGAGTCAISLSSTASLSVSGGEVASPGVAVSACNSASVTVSGGTISGAQRGIDALDSTKVDISAGTLSSSGGFALSVDNAVTAVVSGGEFSSAAGSKAINRAFNAAVTLSGGTFNVASAADVCDSPVFVDRYSAVEKDGKVVVEMTSPAAIVIAEDGTQTAYETFTKACSNAPAYSTVKLMEDAVLGKYSAEVKRFGVTVDLNGFNIDGTAYTGKNAALTLKTSYGDKPVDGKDSTLRLINSVPEKGGKVTGNLPVAGKSGDSRFDVPVFIGDEVELEVVNGGADKVKLDSSAYLVYSDKTATFFSNGGFKVDATDGTQRVYGSYSSAASHAAEGSTVLMLNDYESNESIISGTSVANLDLGGHTYTYTGSQQVFDINYDNAGINVKNGKVVATKPLDVAGVSMLYSNGTFTMDGVAMDVPGDSWGIGTNGTKVNNTIVLKNSTLNVPEGLGIYFPGSGSVTIDDSVINAKHFGVQVCAGDLVVTGSKTAITATGTPQQKTEGDGPIIDGAAISVVERDGYMDLGSVAIKDGTFKSDASFEAVKTYTFNNTDKVEGEWPEAGTVVAVSGGNFSSPVDEGICAEGFAPQENKDGSFGVHEHSFTIAHSDADFHWAECDVCGAVTDKQAHSFTVASHDGEYHWMKCEGCDATVGKAAHSFKWVVDKEATETEPGSKHEECTECGYAKGAVEIPATGSGDSGDTPGSGVKDDDANDDADDGQNANDGEKDEGALAKTADSHSYAVIGFGFVAALAVALAFISRRAMGIRRSR